MSDKNPNDQGQDRKPDFDSYSGRSFAGSRRSITWIVLAIVVLFVLFRTGAFEEWGNQPPVRYLLSDPEVTTGSAGTVVEYWLHVPVGTEPAVTEILISDYIVDAVGQQTVDGLRVSQADLLRFYVFDAPRPGTEEVKRPKVDDPDMVYEYSTPDGLRLREG